MKKAPEKRKSEKYSIASRAQWAGVDKKERSRRMSELVRKRWEKTPKKKRVAFAKRIRSAS